MYLCMSILVSTPYMDESKLCDRIALIQDGKLMKVDTPSAIEEGFEKCVYQIKGKQLYKLLSKLRALPEVDNAYPFGSSLHVYAAHGLDLQSRIKMIYPEEQFEVEVVSADIEDTFMNLMTEVSG